MVYFDSLVALLCFSSVCVTVSDVQRCVNVFVKRTVPIQVPVGSGWTQIMRGTTVMKCCMFKLENSVNVGRFSDKGMLLKEKLKCG